MRRVAVLPCALFCAAWGCSSFAVDETRPVTWHLNAGYSMTDGVTGDYLDDGWIIGGGLRWSPRPDSPFALQVDLHYSGYDATDELIRLGQSQTENIRIDDGDGSVWGLNANGVYTIRFSDRVRGYVTAGIGEYYRKVELTQTVLVGGIFCDPWWGFCYPGVAPGDVVVSDESTTRFAWNAGIGVEFPVSYAGAWFLEARYHRIETSRPTEFIPIQVGFRF